MNNEVEESEEMEDKRLLDEARLDALVIDWFEKWCKDTKRGGGVLIGTSIKELLKDFYKDVFYK